MQSVVVGGMPQASGAAPLSQPSAPAAGANYPVIKFTKYS